ncbi:MAG: hypothetical protein L0Z51_13395 [Candidatus Latescibacteria bacterium]|nr:hypothetical protein [Candidatus Latescibacterota bacterium]
MFRTAVALSGAVLALLLSGPVVQRRPTGSDAGESMRVTVEPLFLAAKYDSILSILPGFIARAEADRDSVLLGRAIAQRGRVSLSTGRQEEADGKEVAARGRV